MSKSNYALKNGVVAQSATMSEAFTNVNITDELADKFISENPNRLKFFVYFPKKWNKKAVELGFMTPETKDEDAAKAAKAETKAEAEVRNE
jgi:hypothetical protein